MRAVLYAALCVAGAAGRAQFGGLRNQGNTCYLNSLLQTLYHVPKLRSAVIDDAPAPAKRGPLARLRLSGMQQQDAQEYLRILVGELLEAPVAGTVRTLYEGALESYLEATDDEAERLGERPSRSRVERFLDRFAYDYAYDRVRKLGNRVRVPFELEAAAFGVDDDGEAYALHAVVIHVGGGLGGHYYAYVDPNLDGNWVKFDDDRVTPVDAAVVAADADGTDYRNGASVGAYLLQYVRKKDAADLGYTGAQTRAESMVAPKAAGAKQKVSPKQLSHEVSEHLTNARWRQALDGLFALTQCEASAVKLGSLQRWVRDADAARDDAPELSRALLWLLCRVASGAGAGAPPSDAVVSRDLFVASARGGGGARAPSDAHVAASFFVALRERAAQRQPPNRHDLTVWASRPGAVALDGDAAPAASASPACPAASSSSTR
ncbi:ubiquitinyl hydrolase [Aureococcus anophagefferens]|nr:ubiquitinyl hydrolase [Aureococcus anophagefferens]